MSLVDYLKNFFGGDGDAKTIDRIAVTFDALKKQHRKALIPFITAGDPDPGMTVRLMDQLARCAIFRSHGGWANHPEIV